MPEELKLTVHTRHMENGKSCHHTETREPKTLEEAIHLAENWPLSRGYSVVESVVESRIVPEWHEVYHYAPRKSLYV